MTLSPLFYCDIHAQRDTVALQESALGEVTLFVSQPLCVLQVTL